MAEIEMVVKENVDGRFFVDDTCIYCELCKEIAPSVFEEHDEGYAYVFKQPITEKDIELTCEALEGCPTESIGDKESPHIECSHYEKKKWWQFWK